MAPGMHQSPAKLTADLGSVIDLAEYDADDEADDHDNQRWEPLAVGTDDEKDARIKEMKESLSAEALCDGFLPGESATYINYTRGLAFDDKPYYFYLGRLFHRRF
ncbi:hypothetical protein N657DRAFT_684068 [Parathielavia appendiculata]|uniref:Uncharacterized protein n=1 Tax=Parathielavia appendiculata TaxID=2587402 RepID=A0AAN6TSF1_9PEZI|nr:hypothetical protein N657DRAFT_684068 [Parathielavia appendiculata]